MSEEQLTGGIVYDALITGAAQKAKVERILTLNLKHLKKVWTGSMNALIEP
ncbi:MAG: hypothetical protein ACUZ8O_02825 [Candidatus Anammoxibacter sp.]